MPILKRIHIRSATETDLDFFFELYRDPEVIKNSKNHTRTTLEFYSAWFKNLLRDNTRHQVYVCCYLGITLGVGRLERVTGLGGTLAQISYSLTPSARKLGYGHTFLSLLLAEARRLKYKKVQASVRSDNLASLCMLLKEHFIPANDEFMDCILDLEAL